MIQKLKNLFSKLRKKSSDEDNSPLAIAYFNLYITEDNEFVINSDFVNGYEESMSKILFLLCSGSLWETMIKVVTERCGDDEDQKNFILLEAYALLAQKVKNGAEDIEPMVDPCDVFNNNTKDNNDID